MLNPTVALQATANTLADRLDGPEHKSGTLWGYIGQWDRAEPGPEAARAARLIDDTVARPAAATLRDLAKRLADTEVDSGVMRRELADAREIITNLRTHIEGLCDRNDRQAATITRMQDAEHPSSAALVDKAALTYLRNRNAEQNAKLLDQARTIGSLNRVIEAQSSLILAKDATIHDNECRLDTQAGNIRSYQRAIEDVDTKLREAVKERDASNARAARLRAALDKIAVPARTRDMGMADLRNLAVRRRAIAVVAVGDDHDDDD